MIILDTNVLSEFMKPAPSPEVMNWAAQQNSGELFTTSITQAEVFYGLALLPLGKRRTQLEELAHQMFNEDFYQRVLPFDSPAAIIYGKLVAHRRQLGKLIAQSDAQIAAIACAHQATLATRNLSDFTDCQLALINPWQFL